VKAARTFGRLIGDWRPDALSTYAGIVTLPPGQSQLSNLSILTVELRVPQH
jgi:hypothetical protein